MTSTHLRLGRLRFALLLLVLTTSCKCESDNSVIAITDDGSAKLVRDYKKEIALGAAGGHGFGIIFPEVNEKTRLTLEIETGPKAGALVKLSTQCDDGDASLLLSADQRTALVRCAGKDTWRISYVLDSSSRSVDLHEEVLGDPPAWDEIPSLAEIAPTLWKRADFSSVLDELKAVDGNKALAIAMSQSVETGSGRWDAHFPTLKGADREKVTRALVARLADEGDVRVLKRAAATLGPTHRVSILAQMHKLKSAQQCGLFRELADRGVNDLGEDACKLATNPMCAADVLYTLAATHHACPEAFKATQNALCKTAVCKRGFCSPEELETRWKKAAEKRNYGNPDEARSILAQRIVQGDSQEGLSVLGERLKPQMNRHGYSLPKGLKRCEPGETKPCLCLAEKYIRRHACMVKTDQTQLKRRGCHIQVDDEARTLTPTPPVPAKRRPKVDMSADAAGSKSD